MNIELTEEKLEEQTNYLLTYDLQQAVIEDLTVRASGVVLTDWKDEESYKKAKTLKSEIKSLFDKIERRRIDLKKFVDAKGKAVTKLIQEPMTYLDSQIAIRDDELKRQKEEVQAKIDGIVREREKALAVEGMAIQSFLLHPDACDDATFEKMLFDAKELRQLRIFKEQELKALEEKKDAELETLRKENVEMKASITNIERPNTSDILERYEDERLRELSVKYPTHLSALKRIMELEDNEEF